MQGWIQNKNVLENFNNCSYYQTRSVSELMWANERELLLNYNVEIQSADDRPLWTYKCK
jgi:hypothetical protein